MHTTKILRVLAALAVVAFVATAAACGGDDTSTASDADTTLPADVDEADVAFVQGMIPHHRQAVDMSEMVIDGGSDPDVVALAEQIKNAQAPEIDQMTGWLEEWGVTTDDGESDGHGMHDDGDAVMEGEVMEGTGMMSDEEMDDMASMSGSDLESMFLRMMIRHHEGAIEMARTELEDGSNADALALAQAIIDTQQAEIDQMNSMLSAS